MLRRRWTRPARPSRNSPASSGPRWVITSRIATSRAAMPSTFSSVSDATIPAIPHTALHRLRVLRAPGRSAVDELTEPQFEHDQLPEAMTMIRAAIAVLRPEPRHFAIVEDAAVAQPAVGEQRCGHRRER